MVALVEAHGAHNCYRLFDKIEPFNSLETVSNALSANRFKNCVDVAVYFLFFFLIIALHFHTFKFNK